MSHIRSRQSLDTVGGNTRVLSTEKGSTMPPMTCEKISVAQPRTWGLMVFALALVAGSSCGGKDLQPTEPDPPWVAEYQTVAKAGCDCKSETCLSEAKQKLDKSLADHGGFDEVPISVHEAHNKFDVCWRAGTTDLARDLAKHADAICRCSDSACVQAFREGMVMLEDKYSTNFEPPLREKLDQEILKELDRGEQCFGALSIPGKEYAAYMQQSSDAVCACGELECMQKVLQERLAKFKGRFFVDSLPEFQSELDASNSKYCGCIGKNVAKELSDELHAGIPLHLNVTVECGG